MVIELIQIYPTISIIVIAFLVTLVSTLITKWLTNQEHLRNLKARQKELQKEIKKCKEDECKMKELNMEMLQITGTMMKSSFKPLFITFIPFLILFAWIRGVYGGEPPLLDNWFWYYLGSAFAFSMIFRKLFKMA